MTTYKDYRKRCAGIRQTSVSGKLAGIASLEDLLHARTRNLTKEHARERVLRIRLPFEPLPYLIRSICFALLSETTEAKRACFSLEWKATGGFLPERRFAYLDQGKLRLHANGAAVTLESQFGRSLRERAAQIQRRHAWKQQGRGAQFMTGMLWPAQMGDPGGFRIAITSVALGRTPGEVLYSLETDDVSGIFAVDVDGVEQRLFHTADFRVRHIALNEDRSAIAASIVHSNFTSSIAVMQVEGTDFLEATEGDSFDLSPRWIPGSGRRLVFQSAGVGRDGAGRVCGLGPFAVQELDLDSGQMERPAEEADYDLLGPRKTSDGALYYIRRPYRSGKDKLRPWQALQDAALFPFRMSYAVFQYFNLFAMRYTGKPLNTSKGAAQRQPDLNQMMVWGNLIDVDRAAREGHPGDPEAPSLVPSSWQLVRQSSSGRKDVLAKSVLSFDIGADGSLLYSNGSAIHRIPPGGGHAERLLVGRMIDQVTAL
jgi:hypothetical protein